PLRATATDPATRSMCGRSRGSMARPISAVHTHGLDMAEIYPLKDLHTGNTVAFETEFNVDGTGFYEEDVLLITANGYQLINPNLPYSATDIETLMSRLKRSKK